MQRLSFFWKIFFALLGVIIISLFVLVITFRISLPVAFGRHMDEMRGMTGVMRMGENMMGNPLFDIFNKTSSEALWLSIPITLLIAFSASWGISRLISAPLRKLFVAAQRISQGKYNERLPMPENIPEKQMDDLQRLSAGFNQMAASLEETENRRRQLIGDISHELRTPLTTIKGSMEGLMDGVLPADQTTYQQIYLEADRMQRLVEDLQELSRIEGDAYTLAREPVDLNELTYMLVRRFVPLCQEKGIHLTNTSEDNLPRILADRDRLEQILVNLLGNALNYTPNGGSVEIHARAIERWMQIEVRDSGIGIAPEDLAHIFTRFYRADKSRSRSGGGSGIGLTIAKHLVEAHGGTIKAESAGVGAGSVFTFVLPLTG
ncbi:MAG: two-component sensor histidine kinase [Chloroflexi bacterium HGW-Chloroflexi-10]|nr:MAG: two-component sensor histidine kinase [Chloroflexi bacterium HGW-Chloroflexi-10]